AALRLPPTLRRLYIASDKDPAGDRAREALARRAEDLGIEVAPLEPAHDDFNDDLRRLGREALAAQVRSQLVAEDAACFCAR
ncbi:MAG: toprim domain-containing protein, partial [Phenylobacterium sp.]|nr:toprim domain-containing protein [Phenylobacterium sp.]